MGKWFAKNKNGIIRSSFLLPILLVVIISISHVVNWYEIGNPVNWAIYLSIAIEIFALTSVSAATININKSTIWFLFALVTMIQLIGNVFFSYNHINENGEIFKSWIELIGPFFEDWDSLSHKRFLALIQGGTLPIMSLTALHFYLKFNENLDNEKEKEVEVIEEEETKEITEIEVKEPIEVIVEPEIVEEKKEEQEVEIIQEPVVEDIIIEKQPEPNVEEESKVREELKREDIKEVKLREKKNEITRIGSNKIQDNNSSNKIIFDGGKRNRNR